MVPEVAVPTKSRTAWTGLAWFSLLFVLCYAPVLARLVNDWFIDADMGHAFFVPLVAGYIIWQRRDELAAIQPKPNVWGLAVLLLGAGLLIAGTLGVELFVTRLSFLATIVGAVWLLRGNRTLKVLALPIFLLCFMIAIPTLVYANLTLRLQIMASEFAARSLNQIDT